jgi:hypothetical protein
MAGRTDIVITTLALSPDIVISHENTTKQVLVKMCEFITL